MHHQINIQLSLCLSQALCFKNICASSFQLLWSHGRWHCHSKVRERQRHTQFAFFTVFTIVFLYTCQTRRIRNIRLQHQEAFHKSQRELQLQPTKCPHLLSSVVPSNQVASSLQHQGTSAGGCHLRLVGRSCFHPSINLLCHPCKPGSHLWALYQLLLCYYLLCHGYLTP